MLSKVPYFCPNTYRKRGLQLVANEVRLTEFGSELHLFLFVHVVQDGVSGLVPHCGSCAPERIHSTATSPCSSQSGISLSPDSSQYGISLSPGSHLLQQQMKVQLADRMKTATVKLVRMTYRSLHSDGRHDKQTRESCQISGYDNVFVTITKHQNVLEYGYFTDSMYQSKAC